MYMKVSGVMKQVMNFDEVSEFINHPQIQESHTKVEESYCIHTDESHELSDVVRELLSEQPLICRWR